jgi:hypothetical protein
VLVGRLQPTWLTCCVRSWGMGLRCSSSSSNNRSRGDHASGVHCTGEGLGNILTLQTLLLCAALHACSVSRLALMWECLGLQSMARLCPVVWTEHTGDFGIRKGCGIGSVLVLLVLATFPHLGSPGPLVQCLSYKTPDRVQQPAMALNLPKSACCQGQFVTCTGCRR